jgi:hypothetical protein
MQARAGRLKLNPAGQVAEVTEARADIPAAPASNIAASHDPYRRLNMSARHVYSLV